MGVPVLTVLGAGTMLPDRERASPAHLLEGGGVRLLLDCGPGTLHGLARHGVAWRDLTHVVVTHFHTDHVGDLGALLFALAHGCRPARTRPLVVAGPEGLASFLRRLADALGRHVSAPGFPLEVTELDVGDVLEVGEGMRLGATPTPHTEASVALRVETPAGAVGYTGDTGPSAEVASFLEGCGVVVAECSLPDPPELDTHLTPAGLARMAAAMRPGLLVLTHIYPMLSADEAVRAVHEAGYRGAVVAGRDGLRLDPGGRVL